MLFDHFWYEGEVCILFADTNVGKSILAVQIGNSIAKGEPIKGFELGVQQLRVIYFDFELTEKQFENRYSEDYKNHYVFHENFYRSEMNPDFDMPENVKFEDYLYYSLENEVIDKKASVLIIDNLTFLKDETEKAKDALPLMKKLKALKNKFNLSLLILAHTPKRDQTKPITKNDLSGSRMLMSFCDSSFAIGESTEDKSLRYLKQIKVRNGEHVYDSDNVVVCQIDKPINFLGFEYLKRGSEQEYLKPVSSSDKAELENEIITTYKSNPNLSLRKIADKLRTNHRKVGRVLERHGIKI